MRVAAGLFTRIAAKGKGPGPGAGKDQEKLPQLSAIDVLQPHNFHCIGD